MAGEILSRYLSSYKGENPLILAVPRGGVVVAYPVFLALGGDLDLLLVKKLGSPENPEFAYGAVTESGEVLWNESVPEEERKRYPREWIEKRKEEIQKVRELYSKAGFPFIPRKNRIVIVIDDGIATGTTLLAGILSLKRESPGKIVLAVPVGPSEAKETFSSVVDEFVLPLTPYPFYAVGEFYDYFPQITDEEVIEILQKVKEKKEENS